MNKKPKESAIFSQKISSKFLVCQYLIRNKGFLNPKIGISS